MKLLNLVACLAAAVSLSANADTLYGADFGSSNTYSTAFVGGTATFTSSPRNFQLKSQDGITGVGIKGGRTDGEIDLDETITGTFSSPVRITGIRLGLLFDGPEYKDVNEVASITATFLGGLTQSFTLTATGTHTAVWTGFGSVASVGSGAIYGGTGAWDISNPFGGALVTGLSFTALPGVAAPGCMDCCNQSDYTLVSISAVPEPESYAMLIAGLGLLGTMVRRRRGARG